jgi:hypothetical protein
MTRDNAIHLGYLINDELKVPNRASSFIVSSIFHKAQSAIERQILK